MNVSNGYLTIHGSHGYGLNGPTSDMDHRGFFFLDKETFFSLNQGPEQVDSNKDGLDFVSWEFRKFIRLAASSNPNVIETLFTDPRDVLTSSLASSILRTNARDWFLSKKVKTTFGGYASQQFGKLSKNFDKWEDSGVRKDAMHCVRLIYMAQEMLETGNLTVKFDTQRHPEKVNFMMSIRRGTVKSVPVFLWAQQNLETLDDLKAKSSLPEEPKLDLIHKFVRDTLIAHYGS